MIRMILTIMIIITITILDNTLALNTVLPTVSKHYTQQTTSTITLYHVVKRQVAKLLLGTEIQKKF